MRRALMPSRRRQVVCVIQVYALIVALLPAVPLPQSTWLAAAALSAIVYSFFADTIWLWRHVPGNPVTMRS
jgi:hypothetical protein